MYIPESTQKYNLTGGYISHRDLAMKAAKAMPRSRQKAKTGHIVCRHLLDMLSEEPAQPVSRRTGALMLAFPTSEPRNRISTRGFSTRGLSTRDKQNNEKQFLLAL